MENEIRFYHSLKDYEILKEKLLKISSLNFAGRNYEKTSQFNHPMPKYDFYSKEIDGRFRVRITKGETSSKCKISWKRRIKNKSNALINQEEEVELYRFFEFDKFFAKFHPFFVKNNQCY